MTPSERRARAETVLVLFERGCLKANLEAVEAAMRAGISPEDLAIAASKTRGTEYEAKKRASRPEGLVVLTGFKWCPGCNQVKRLSGFHANRSSADGHQSRCAVCMVESVRASRKRRVA